jgi:hypothetical protein
MWWTEEGDRVLTDAEWDVFNTGLDSLRDLVESDIGSGENDLAMVGIRAFDDLTAEQKLALLADVAEALRNPSVPSPTLNAANEAAVAAVFTTFEEMLVTEIEFGPSETGEQRTELRRLILKAVGHLKELEEPLPSENEVDTEEWAFLVETLEGRIFWDNDFTMDDEFLDLPSDEARAQLDFHGIDPDYYLSIPPEPDQAGLVDVRKRLAQVQRRQEQSD